MLQFLHTQEDPCSWVEQAAVFVGLFGGLRVLRRGDPVSLPPGCKSAELLRLLALAPVSGVRRHALLEGLWPECDPRTAGRSLNSLVYSLHRLLGDALDHVGPVVYRSGMYSLNVKAGITVDVHEFDRLSKRGNEALRAGLNEEALHHYRLAVRLYRGDVDADDTIALVLERERLRVRYLSILAHLADTHYAARDYARALDLAALLLTHDPCREDAHRIAMRCFVKVGQRSQALRQYRVCQQILNQEFGIAPERETELLLDTVRRCPETIC